MSGTELLDCAETNVLCQVGLYFVRTSDGIRGNKVKLSLWLLFCLWFCMGAKLGL
jgi:hypothetical protein